MDNREQFFIDENENILHDEDYVMETGQVQMPEQVTDLKFRGLQLKVGIVYEIDKENMTVTIADGDGSIGKKPTVASMAKEPYTTKAMILCRSMGMAVDPVKQTEKFCCDVEFPQIGTHVVYANLYGHEGGIEHTICLGNIFPMQFDYNVNEMFGNIKRVFETLGARRCIDSPTGYFWLEKENGDIYEGFYNVIDPTAPIKVWQSIKFVNGNYEKIIYDASGSQEMVKITIDNLGNYKLETKIGAKFGLNSTGLIQFENSTVSLKTILTEMKEVLQNLVSGTGNWQGNLGAPLVYIPQVLDTAKLLGITTKINALLG